MDGQAIVDRSLQVALITGRLMISAEPRSKTKRIRTKQLCSRMVCALLAVLERCLVPLPLPPNSAARTVKVGGAGGDGDGSAAGLALPAMSLLVDVVSTNNLKLSARELSIALGAITLSSDAHQRWQSGGRRVTSTATAVGSATDEGDALAWSGQWRVRMWSLECRLVHTLLRGFPGLLMQHNVHAVAACVRRLLKRLVDLVSVPATAPAALASGTVEHMSRLLQAVGATSKEALRKYAPYMLADFVSLASCARMPATAKRTLEEGAFSIMDACGEHEFALLHVSLDHAGRGLFKQFHDTYVKFHKFTGRT